MGQKSNILTLRPNKHFSNNTLNLKEVFSSESFIKALKRSFDKKGVLITAYNHTDNIDKANISLDIFLKSAKLLKFRKKIKLLSNIKKSRIIAKTKNTKKRIRTLIKKFKGKKRIVLRKKKAEHLTFLNILHKCIQTKLAVIKITVVNKKENFVIKASILKKLNKFKKNLFARRFNLFYDFVKLSSLFLNKDIDINTYCNILGSIFKYLPKRSHAKYFLFVKTLIGALIKFPGSKIKGIKVVINGKLKGKLRASEFKTSRGEIEIQTIAANNDLSQVHIHTLYGAFGLTMWVNYVKENTEKELKKETKKSLPKNDKIVKPKTKKTKKSTKITTEEKIKKLKKVNPAKKISQNNTDTHLKKDKSGKSDKK